MWPKRGLERFYNVKIFLKQKILKQKTEKFGWLADADNFLSCCCLRPGLVALTQSEIIQA